MIRAALVAAINAACWPLNLLIERYENRLNGDDDD